MPCPTEAAVATIQENNNDPEDKAMNVLQGRRALITGASHGVGAATAKAMAHAGAEVVIAARN